MAADIFTDTAGQRSIRTLDGWRAITEDEAGDLDQSAPAAAGRSAFLSFVEPFNALIASGPVGGRHSRPSTIDPQVTQDFAAGLVGDQRAEQERRAITRPEASAFGENALLVADIGLGLSGVAHGAMRSLSRRTASRTAARAIPGVTAEAGEVSAQATGRDLKSLSAQLGESTPEVVDAIANVPKYRPIIQRLKNRANRGLSADQKELIANGTVARTGFRMLPGQANGVTLAEDAVTTLPEMAEFFGSTLRGNSADLARKTARSVGLTADAYGRGILGESRRSVGNMFDTVEGAIQPQRMSDDLVKDISDSGILTAKDRRAFSISKEGEATVGEWSGRELMEMRSKINEALSTANRNGDLVQARQINETLDGFDDFIMEGLDDSTKALWQEARQRWRMVLALDKPGVIDKATGEISLKGLVNAMESQFKTEFKRELNAAPTAGMPQDMVELMEFARVARTFSSNLGNSGTATRNRIVEMVKKHPVGSGVLGGAGALGILFE